MRDMAPARRRTQTEHPRDLHVGTTESVAFSPDGRLFAVSHLG